MKKALVTGGAGFIGSHLVDALVKKGIQVVVLDDFSTGKKENLSSVIDSIGLVEGSVTDAESVKRAAEGADVIFHLAAVASVQKSIEEPLVTHDVNTRGTLAVFDAARALDISKVVYVSSCTVYGMLPELPKRETSPCCPASPYGLHKMIGEGYAKLYHELHGLSSTGLRFFNVFGPRQDASSPYSGVISIFHDRLSKRQPITIFGDGETTRDFVYVDDVVAALITAAQPQAGGTGADVYNIGTGKETSLRAVVKAFESALGTAAEVTYAPERQGDIKHSVADITKAKNELGWSPEVSFEEGIKMLVQ
jgi:UDP-glucose 4-epimerase